MRRVLNLQTTPPLPGKAPGCVEELPRCCDASLGQCHRLGCWTYWRFQLQQNDEARIKRAQLIGAYRSAFRAVFLVSTGLAAVSLLCTFFFIKTKSVDRPLEDGNLQAEYRQSLCKENPDPPLVLTGQQIYQLLPNPLSGLTGLVKTQNRANHSSCIQPHSNIIMEPPRPRNVESTMQLD
ncbi:hypothetical protein PGT21_032391 [Puccinia graminis f. sp. tritici]|uniref:Uncharacterized protein n=1 Tax=Puccinia graminis f. sp. tritici TaxID=56615 RepID=A0A5B0NQ07_PUCGR|nr:hypothetical protein PGTUg99_033544 [Puccinia graminis f. sp. tritici]KAA1091377.1 hypothetical protein PGT21_032391 [Puccinia graminis f. sp. tritici]